MSEKIIVSVTEGKVRGVKMKSSFSGTEYYSFFGVPYGQSTGKQMRYKDPVKVRPWKNDWDGTTEKQGCIQFALKFQRVQGSEDCLYNNIHTSKLPSAGEPLKPVIVVIHPGAFFHGSPETFYFGSPDYVMHHNIVYVGISFRLHIFGFLNLNVEKCCGNQALKDIVLGLRWIKENIHNFGGDPENVTLLGCSSGAISVHHLMLSPAAKGLFHKAVIMGGYAFNPTASVGEDNVTKALKLARDIGYRNDSNNKKELLLFLKKTPPENLALFKGLKELTRDTVTLIPSSPFAPTTDTGENAVLPEHHRKLIPSIARIPVIFGICDNEAATGFTKGLINTTMEKYYQSFLQSVYGWGRNISEDQLKLIQQEVEQFYLNGESIDKAPISLKIDIQSDIVYSDVYETLLDPISNDLPSSVYVYRFTFDGNASTMKSAVQALIEQPLEGSFHASDFSYWSLVNYNWGSIKNEELNERSIAMVKTFTKLITTFASTGNPNYFGIEEQWKPTTPQNPCHFIINDSLKMVDDKLNGDGMRFWECIRQRYGQQ